MSEVSLEMATFTVRVCALEDLPVGLGRAFDIGQRRIAFFRTRRGQVFAVDNRCPHKGGPLAEGMLAGDAVVCPLHAFKFELATGTCDQMGTCALETYPVTEKAGEIFVTVPADR